MKDKQKELLNKLGNNYMELADECEDESFNEFMMANNHLYPLSLDKMGSEWLAVSEEKISFNNVRYPLKL